MNPPDISKVLNKHTVGVSQMYSIILFMYYGTTMIIINTEQNGSLDQYNIVQFVI